MRRLPKYHFDHFREQHPGISAVWQLVDRGDLASADLLLWQAMGVTSDIPSIQSQLGYRHFGMQSYCIGPGLQHMLSETSIKGIASSDIKVPFPTFYLALEDSPFELWGGPGCRWTPVHGMYVSLNNPIFGDQNHLMVYMVSLVKRHCASFWYTINLDHAGDDLPGAMNTVLNGSIMNPDDENAAAAKKMLAEYEGKEGVKRNKQNAHNALAFLVNFLLYITSQDAELRKEPRSYALYNNIMAKIRKAESRGHHHKVHDLEMRLTAKKKPHVTWVAERTEKRLRDKGIIVNGESGRSQLTRFWRKGHWHHYWVGPKRDEFGNEQLGDRRILKWVEPCVVNADRAASVTKRVRRISEPA